MISTIQLSAFRDELEKIAMNPALLAILAGTAGGGIMGAVHGGTQPFKQDDMGNIYQPTVADRFAGASQGLYRGSMGGAATGALIAALMRGKK